MHRKGKINGKKLILLFASIGVVGIVIIGCVFLKKGTGIVGNVANRGPYSDENSGVSAEGMITAYGVINIGTEEEILDVDNLTQNLVVEEVCVASDDIVSAGDVLVRFSAESVEKALEELAKNVRTKDLAYRAGAIEYEQSLINAKYNYDSAVLKGEQAETVYNETVADLKASLETSTKTYNESVAQLSEYQEAEANDSYYTEYQVEYYKNLYDENLALLNAKVEEWGISWEEITRGNVRYSEDLQDQYKYVCQQLYSILETNARDYENAVTNYENSKADLSYNLMSLKLNMSTIEENYQNAKKNYEINLLNAEQTKQTALTNAELAQSEYEAKVEKAKTDYQTLKDAYETAQADYENFQKSVVDNAFVASKDGTVMRVSTRKNSRISANSRILTYVQSDDVTVSVSVDQKDIAKLSVGDTAICYSADEGMISGVISSISPVTQSDSISSVNYSVTVKVSSTSKVPNANATVTVIFGMDMEAAEKMDMSGFTNQGGENQPDGMPDMNNFFGENMPDMSNFPGGGITPGRGAGQ